MKLVTLAPFSLVILAAVALFAPLESAAQEATVPVSDVVSRADEVGLSFRVTTNTTARGFDVVLIEAPVDPVSILITTDDPGAAVALVSSLEFDAGNWSTPQTVRIRSVIDADADDEEVTFTLTNTANGESVTRLVRINDSISGALLVNPSAIQTLEAGESVEYTTRLELAPSADVVVEVAASDASLFTPQTLTFTPENWDQGQTSVVTVPDTDTLGDSQDELTLTFTVNDGVSAPEYAGLEAVRIIELAEAELAEEQEPDTSLPDLTDPVEPSNPADPEPEVPTTPTTPIPDPTEPNPEDDDADTETPENGFGAAAPEEGNEEDNVNAPSEDLDDPEVTTPIGVQPDVTEPGEVEPDTGFGGAAPETDTVSDDEAETEAEDSPVGTMGPGGLIRTGGYSG